MFEKNPLERHRNEDGFIQLKDTGDDLIDRWEEQIAQGVTPDLLEAFDPKELKKLERMRAKAANNPNMPGMSLKGAVEAAEREAAKQKLTTTNPSITPKLGWTQGFGDGS